MVRASGRLTALKVTRAPVGMHCDGDGLYLQVTPNGRSWIYRYELRGRVREMGLGPCRLFSLAEARDLAQAARKLRHQGIDPIERRKAERAQNQIAAAAATTFQQCADAYIAAHKAGWRNEVHRGQWTATIATYAAPIIGGLPVAAIDTALVLKVIEPLWTTKPETASRLRGRIEAILDWAKVRGYRTGENPARWRGHLDHLLPSRSKVQRVKRHEAVPYAELPALMTELAAIDHPAAPALAWTILTAARAGETLGATWDEIDLAARTWTIPGHRMKAGKDHRVPLSAAAISLLGERREGRVFAIGENAMAALLKKLRPGVTVHGMRSAFSDWAHERTGYSNHAIEMSLAHSIGTAVERAYRRTDLFDQRRRLMEQWATFCTTAPAETGQVITLHEQAS
jgi:integrase